MAARGPRPHRPDPSPSPEQAAAVVAALERFLRDTGPRARARPPQPSAWARAALLEAAGHAAGDPVAWRQRPGP